MPAKLERCVKEVMSQGKTEQQAYAICNASIYQDEVDTRKKENKKHSPD